MVADIASAEKRNRVVGDHQLVVHAVVQAVEVTDQVEDPRGPAHEGVEQPDLDIRMGVQTGEDFIASVDVDIVDEKTHAHTAIRAAQQGLREDAPALVRIPDVVLQIEAVLGELRHGHADGKGVAPCRDQRDTRSARMAFFRGPEQAAQRGAAIGRKGTRLDARIVRVQRRTGCQKQRCKTEKAGPASHRSPHDRHRLPRAQRSRPASRIDLGD